MFVYAATLVSVALNILSIDKRIMTSGKYLNKGVMALESPHIEHVTRDTYDKIVVFGDGNARYDIL